MCVWQELPGQERSRKTFENFSADILNLAFDVPLISLPWIIEKKSYFEKRGFDISISGFAGYDAEYTETDRKDIQNLAQEIETKYTQYGEELTQKINPNFGTSTLMSIFRIEERYRVRDWRHIAVVLSGDVPGLVPGQDELQGGGGDRLHAQHSGEQAVTVSLSIKEFSTFIDLLFLNSFFSRY